jgi:hypothetical protein
LPLITQSGDKTNTAATSKLGQQIKLVIRSNQGEHRKRTSAVPDLSFSHESQQQTQKETASGMRA